jgi:tetratricopeptide (TPR) repeat protein
MDPRRPWRICIILSVAASLLLSFAFPLAAYAGMEEEAERQLQLAEEDLEAGNCERAAASAASAQRADPSRHEAFVVRALALQCLGDLEDAAALLRAYKVLRGTLALDERVEPALAEIERELGGDEGGEVTPPMDPVADAVEGPFAVLYGPDGDEKAAEQAYTVAEPFLGGKPAVAVLSLASVLPRDASLVLGGVEAVGCDVGLPDGEVAGHLEAAGVAVTDLEPEAAFEAADAAELMLACGAEQALPADVARLLAVRAQAHWVAGEPEGATRLWRELFALDPERSIDGSLPPSAQALQLDAKSRARTASEGAELVGVVPKGWDIWIDGVQVGGEASLLPGRRMLRLEGPEAQHGAILVVERGQQVLVGTAEAVYEAVFADRPPGPVLAWAGREVGPAIEQHGAAAAVVVNLDTKPPTVRLFDGSTFLVVTPTPEKEQRAIAAAGNRSGPHPASVALLGGGLAATVVGVIVAAVSHSDGVGLQGGMATVSGYDAAYAGYEAARTREQVGIGIAIGGGVVAAVGGVTFALPQPRVTGKASSE